MPSSIGKLYYIGLGTLASEYDNKIPFNERWVQSRLGIAEPPDFQELFDSGLIVKYDDGKNQTDCKQDASILLAKLYSRNRNRNSYLRRDGKKRRLHAESFAAESRF